VSKAKAISEKMAHRNGVELSENVWLDAKASVGNVMVGLIVTVKRSLEKVLWTKIFLLR